MGEHFRRRKHGVQLLGVIGPSLDSRLAMTDPSLRVLSVAMAQCLPLLVGVAL
jgi:hypothetical protein